MNVRTQRIRAKMRPLLNVDRRSDHPTSDSMIPVILSGGSGTRLWPLSREAFPKQFLNLLGKHSLLQSTWDRIAPLATSAPLVVANEEHRFMVAEQLREAD